MGRSAVRVRSSALCQDAHPWCWVTVAVLARCYPKSIMTETTHHPRVDAYIESLPDWQQGICRRVRALVHAADPEMTETIKRTDRPYFVLQGNVCALDQAPVVVAGAGDLVEELVDPVVGPAVPPRFVHARVSGV